ncbi:MAG: radical SAM family heme chaperone HemW [Clostridiales bacterium]|nr:radical SAM family heme chaperone HemW [Clostridiales bacterium]
MNKNNEFSIYIHIPFCISKCKYCDFNSYSNKNSLIDKYVEKLILDIQESQYFEKDRYICKTIYFGGGTPSYIDEKYIEKILTCIKEKFKIDKNAEITIECNPSSITENKLKTYFESGINRISIGLQSTNNNILEIIGRKHTYEIFLEKYNLIKEIGFNNINIDLMIGLPNQKLDDVKQDLEKVISLNPTHISSYSLIVYEETKMYDEILSNKYIMPSDDEEREMYYFMQDKLKKAGYNQYEISNFSKIGYESKHNTMCWKQKEYIGFGAGAHSFINNKRMYYIDNIEKFLNTKHMIIEEELSEIELMKEYMIIGLRMLEGIDKKQFEIIFNKKLDDVFKSEIKKLEKRELIENSKTNIKLTRKGIDFANIVWEEFI